MLNNVFLMKLNCAMLTGKLVSFVWVVIIRVKEVHNPHLFNWLDLMCGSLRFELYQDGH